MFSELTTTADQLQNLFQSEDGDSNASESLSAEGFGTLALRLFELQYSLNSSYRALCEGRSIHPTQVTDWRDIPSVPTSAFKEFDFTCLSETERLHYFESSGTTAQRRSRVHHSSRSLKLYEASLLPWFQRHVTNHTSESQTSAQSRSFISLTPSKATAPHSSLVHMLDTVARRMPFQNKVFLGSTDRDGAWTLTQDAIQHLAEQIAESSTPALLAGTAFNFVHLLDELKASEIRSSLPNESCVVETGGYKGRSRELTRHALHREISQRLEVPQRNIITEYGMCELNSQAYDRGTGSSQREQLLQFPPWARALIVSPETGREVAQGEVGIVRVVDLANAFSVLAIETEDLAIRRSGGFELLGRRPQSENRGCSLMSASIR